ncbi:MAG: T9SS type A sorting domain-containing protein [Ignavibacteriaceae bacterium]
MKTRLLLFSVLAVLIYPLTAISQQRPQISFEDLMLNAELDYKNILAARDASLNLAIPVSIYLEEGIFIESKGVENNKPVYAVVRDLLNPYNNSDVMFYEEVASTFNIENARINSGSGQIINPDLGFSQTNNTLENINANYLLVSESSNNSVMLLDFATGDLVMPDFIPPQSNLSVLKQARQSPHTTISISDQTGNVIVDYDTTGSLIGIFAPSIGPHTGILQNVRGHDYNPINNHLFVCNAQGGNFNRVVEFDAMGNYIAQFFPDNSGGLLGPFDILFRDNDVLVTGSTSGAAHRYDHGGNYLDDFGNQMNFPQQMVKFPNDNIGIATFGSYQGGLKIYDPGGNLINDFNSVIGLRGVHYLGSGNIIVTNAAGVHEINGTTGDLVRTIVAGVSGQYINSCDFVVETIPVELVSFSASVVNNSISLSWVTASEINNSGFEIEKKVGSGQYAVGNPLSWEKIGFVEGNGTTTETKYYSFVDEGVSAGIYNYRLKQFDFDGTFEYSNEVQVEVHGVAEYSLSQNYPNPFNPSTTIEFQIPSDGFVTLTIYNTIGQEVSKLVNEYRSAGNFSITFSGEKLPSGLYFYTLRSGDFKKTKKMLLLR